MLNLDSACKILCNHVANIEYSLGTDCSNKVLHEATKFFFYRRYNFEYDCGYICPDKVEQRVIEDPDIIEEYRCIELDVIIEDEKQCVNPYLTLVQ